MKLSEIKSTNESVEWLKSLNVPHNKYAVTHEGTIEVIGNISLSKKVKGKLGATFSHTKASGADGQIGNFLIHNNPELTSLEGCPTLVAGDFDADYCEKLTSLEGGPANVSGAYSVFHCALTTLKGCPIFVGDDFDVSTNKLTELDYLPKQVLGSAKFNNNKLTSLKGIEKMERCNGNMLINGNPIKSHILGVLKINGLEQLVVDPVKDSKDLIAATKIINKYIGKGKAGIIAAQEELIESDLDDFAEM